MKKEFEQFGILADDISDENVDFKKLQEIEPDSDDERWLKTSLKVSRRSESSRESIISKFR